MSAERGFADFTAAWERGERPDPAAAIAAAGAGRPRAARRHDRRLPGRAPAHGRLGRRGRRPRRRSAQRAAAGPGPSSCRRCGPAPAPPAARWSPSWRRRWAIPRRAPRSRSTCTISRPASSSRGACARRWWRRSRGSWTCPRRCSSWAGGWCRPPRRRARRLRFTASALPPGYAGAVGARRGTRARSPRSTTSSPAPMDEIAAARTALARFTATYAASAPPVDVEELAASLCRLRVRDADDLCPIAGTRAGDAALGRAAAGAVGDLGAPRRAARPAPLHGRPRGRPPSAALRRGGGAVPAGRRRGRPGRRAGARARGQPLRRRAPDARAAGARRGRPRRPRPDRARRPLRRLRRGDGLSPGEPRLPADASGRPAGRGRPLALACKTAGRSGGHLLRNRRRGGRRPCRSRCPPSSTRPSSTEASPSCRSSRAATRPPPTRRSPAPFGAAWR